MTSTYLPTNLSTYLPFGRGSYVQIYLPTVWEGEGESCVVVVAVCAPDLQLIAVVVAAAFSWTSSSSASGGGGDDGASVAADGGTEKLRLRREELCKYRRNCVLKCNRSSNRRR